MTRQEDVLVEEADGIIVITMNRPDRRNAINREITWGVSDAIDRHDARNDLSVGIPSPARAARSAPA